MPHLRIRSFGDFQRGMGDVAPIADAQNDPNYALGVAALTAFQQYAYANYPNTFPYSDYPTFLSVLGSTYTNPYNFTDYNVSGLGDAIANANMSSSAYTKSMQDLADAGQGNLPADPQMFISALTKQATATSFVGAVKAVTAGTVEQIGSGVAAVGNSVIAAGQGVLGAVGILSNPWVLAVVALGAVGLFIYLESGALAGSVHHVAEAAASKLKGNPRRRRRSRRNRRKS